MKSVAANLFIWAFGLLPVAGCAFGIPLKEPDIVTRQAERSSTLRVGESTVANVREALGEPLLQSRYWGVDVYETEDLQKELAFFVFFTPPVPMGVFSEKIGGYVLVTYDNKGLVSKVVSGTAASDGINGQDGLVLGAGDLHFVIEEFGTHGPQLIVQSTRLQDYLTLQRDSSECILVLACERPRSPERWPNEACPDRVVIDAGVPLEPQPLFSACEQATCPDTAVQGGGGYRHIPLLYPVALSSGQHQLELSSSIFKGRDVSTFSCVPGQVLYGGIHGNVDWHWWGPGSSTLNASVSMSAYPPPDWKSYSGLLYRLDHWLVAPDPEERTE